MKSKKLSLLLFAVLMCNVLSVNANESAPETKADIGQNSFILMIIPAKYELAPII